MAQSHLCGSTLRDPGYIRIGGHVESREGSVHKHEMEIRQINALMVVICQLNFAIVTD